MTALPDATLRQNEASDPRVSVWLSANAGSGKTRVLTDRVARLLLAGVPPQNILCLTYTKAAAGEMQNRLFRGLGEWAMFDGPSLRAALAGIGADPGQDDEALARARRLFARAIDTPGGLKIQTIHSFCASLLRQFPVEAGVTPNFAEMDERDAALLRREVLESIAESPDAALLQDLGLFGGEDLDGLARAILGKARDFDDPLQESRLAASLGVPEGLDEAAVLAKLMTPEVRPNLERARPILAAGSPRDVTRAEAIALIDYENGPLEGFENAFLTGEFVPYKTIATGPTAKVLGPQLNGFLEDFKLRVAEARNLRLKLRELRKTLVLWAFGRKLAQTYARRKQDLGRLDFDDLIARARGLLANPAVAPWVLYRLDGGIDHILVDEAQDTSPEQWAVIEALAQEITSGRGARDERARTLFVVGDQKQSIYSFQGADPAAFADMRDRFRARLADGPGLNELPLEYSFRSSPAILRVVDEVCRAVAGAGIDGGVSHIAFNPGRPGRVDLWPLVPPPVRGPAPDWSDTSDLQLDEAASVDLARQLADEIDRMIREDQVPGDDGVLRPVRAGDILILVRTRSFISDQLLKELKARQLPVAGADQVALAREIAVQDLRALLEFLEIPEDSLALATILRSPLFGWSEQMLFDLAHRRTERHLWAALRDRAGEFPETLAALHDLRDQTEFLRPFELLERALTRHDMRRRLVARLGPEAEDGIDVLLSQALAFEQRAVPGLTGFLVWLGGNDDRVKRQAEALADKIRVMTVHGAKGLESRIVILPDTLPRKAQPHADPLVRLGDGQILWAGRNEECSDVTLDAKGAVKRAGEEEANRLLYVALTRPKCWLIVCGAGTAPSAAGSSWYQKVEAAVLALGPSRPVVAGRQILRIEHGAWDATGGDRQPGAVSAPAAPPPGWLRSAPPPARKAATVLSPSDLGGAKALPGEAGQDQEAALRFGSQLHLLLERLPDFDRDAWVPAARSLLAGAGLAPDEAGLGPLVAKAGDLLTAPALGAVFSPLALAEVPVSGTLPDGRQIVGRIDRLVVGSDRVLAVDFKTNAVVPARPNDVPDGILAQMAAYVSALGQIYPGRRVEAAILWTATGDLMQLPHDILLGALESLSTS